MGKKKLLIIGLPLLVLIAGLGYVLKFRPSQQQLFQDAILFTHKANQAAITLEPPSPSYPKIMATTSKIVNDSILVPRERQMLLKLLVDPATFPREMEKSDYIEIQPKQPLKVEGQTAEYDKIRFVLTGGYEGIIFLHAGTGYWGAWSPLDKKEFWGLREPLGLSLLPEHLQTSTPTLHRATSPPVSEDHKRALQKLGIGTTGFYKEYTANPATFDPDQLTLYPEVCRKGGYDLSSYLDQNLTFTGYRTDVIYQVTRGKENEVVKEEPLNVWVVSSDSKIVCIYLSVREDSTMAPGIFSVNDPLLNFPSR